MFEILTSQLAIIWAFIGSRDHYFLVDLEPLSRSQQGQMRKIKMLNIFSDIGPREKELRIEVVQNCMPDTMVKSNYGHQVALKCSSGAKVTNRQVSVAFDFI